MAVFHWQDNLSSTAFTPRDYQVELLAAAIEDNIIVCLGHNSSKEFIALKLILEKSHELRRNNNQRVTLIVTSTPTGGESMYNLIFHLTDLKVLNLNTKSNEIVDWKRCLTEYQVIIANVAKCLHVIQNEFIDFRAVNLIVIEDCHKKYCSPELDSLMNSIAKDKKEMPKILGLAGPLHSAGCPTDELGFHVEMLEKSMLCKVETASDIVTVLR